MTVAIATQPPQAGIAAPPHAEGDFTALVDRLTSIPRGKYHIISCYLSLGPEERERQKYRIELKRRIQVLKASDAVTALERDARGAVERDLAHLAAHLEDPANLPPARGVAIFACEALDLFTVVPLPRVRRTRLMLDDTPWIRELVASASEFGRVIVAALDRMHARFFEVTAAGAVELPCLPSGAQRGGKFRGDRRDAPGWGEHDYHRRLEHERHRQYVDVVRELERLTDQRVIRGIVIAGPLDHRSAVALFLPRPLAARLLGTLPLDPATATHAQVQAAAFQAAEAYDRAATRRMLVSFEEALGSGWAVDGPRATLQALARGQVRLLLVRADAEGSGYRCARTGRLTLVPGDCRGEGDPVPVSDVADEAVEEALRQQVEVVTVPDDVLGDVVDGIGAMLRFR